MDAFEPTYKHHLKETMHPNFCKIMELIDIDFRTMILQKILIVKPHHELFQLRKDSDFQYIYGQVNVFKDQLDGIACFCFHDRDEP